MNNEEVVASSYPYREAHSDGGLIPVSDTPERKRMMEEELQILEEAVNNLSLSVNKLETRLKPITSLRPEKESVNKMGENSSQPSMVAVIAEERSKIVSLMWRIQILEETVEI